MLSKKHQINGCLEGSCISWVLCSMNFLNYLKLFIIFEHTLNTSLQPMSIIPLTCILIGKLFNMILYVYLSRRHIMIILDQDLFSIEVFLNISVILRSLTTFDEDD